MGTLVAAADWLGRGFPSPDEPALRTVLRVANESCLAWAYNELPQELIHVGTLKLSAAEARRKSNTVIEWAYFLESLKEHWQRQHDPEFRRAEAEWKAKIARDRPVLARHRRLMKKLGATFAVPLADGRYGACRIVRVDPARQMSLFAATEYLDAQPPNLAQPRLRTILVANTTHAALTYGPCVRWQYWIEPPPADFQYLGTIAPAAEEQRYDPSNFSKLWDGWPAGILMEWRWRHDRASLAAEYDRIHGAGAFGRMLRKNRPRTLASLAKKKFFSAWKGDVPAAALRGSKELLVELVQGLISLGEKPTKKLARPLVKKCLQAFNRLDEAHEFIATIEREDILQEVFGALDAAGLPDCDAWGEEWRDW